MREMNVAVIGCGFVADGHLGAWNKLPEARVKAVVDLNEQMAKKTAESWKIPKYYTSLSDLVKNETVNLVDIATPPQTHAAIAVEAMNSGVDVLIEKPMTMTVKDAQQILDAQKNTGRKAGVLHNWLFDSPVLEANSLIKQGKVGKIVNVQVEALHTKADSMAADSKHWCHTLAGGRFSEMLAHPIYLIRHFLNATSDIEIGDVYAAKLGDYPWMKSDEFCSTFRVGDTFGRAYVSFDSPRDAIFINIYGKEALIRLDLINATINVLPRRATGRFSKASDSLRQASQLTKSTLKNVFNIGTGRWYSGHEMCIKLFAESYLNDTEPPVTLQEGYNVIRTLEQLCKKLVVEENKIKS